MLWTYRAKIVRWIDGDTVQVSVDMGFRCYRTERLRLVGSTAGVNAAELTSSDPAQRALAAAALYKCIELFPEGADVIIRTHRPVAGDKLDGFNRYLAEVLFADGRSLGDLLLQEGLAKPYVRG